MSIEVVENSLHNIAIAIEATKASMGKKTEAYKSAVVDARSDLLNLQNIHAVALAEIEEYRTNGAADICEEIAILKRDKLVVSFQAFRAICNAVTTKLGAITEF